MSNKITDLLYEFNARADITIESLADLISDIAVPVVRCKDCRFWYRDFGENKCLEFADVPLEPNDFCSHGERREDEAG